MKRSQFKIMLLCAVASVFSGCASSEFNKSATDVALTGTGGVIGYKLSNGSPGMTAAGATAGYLVSKIAQSSMQKSLTEAEKSGYDRAMNQAVKQQYWVIQNQQKSLKPESEHENSLTPVVVPESKINGIIIKAHVEYIRVE